MDDNNTELIFQYIIYQPMPNKQKVYVWIDGENYKKIYRMDYLRQAMYAQSPSLSSDLEKSFLTYSFYLWDSENEKILKLNLGMDKVASYKNSVTSAVHQMKTYDELLRPPPTLFDKLQNMGFHTPEIYSDIEKELNPSTGFFGQVSRFFNKMK